MRANEIEHGDVVAIYVLSDARAADDVIGTYGQTAMCASVGDDYAVTNWPIVIKVKRQVTRPQLVRHLLDLAAAIETRRLFVDHDGGSRGFLSV